MSRVTHFEIAADDPDRAAKFYGEAFGWKFSKWDGPMDYWMIQTGPEGELGINGGLSRRSDNPDNSNTIGVESIDKAIQKVEAAGGNITRPKMAVPGVGWLAYFTDTEGNLFGMMEDDPSAK